MLQRGELPAAKLVVLNMLRQQAPIVRTQPTRARTLFMSPPGICQHMYRVLQRKCVRTRTVAKQKYWCNGLACSNGATGPVAATMGG